MVEDSEVKNKDTIYSYATDPWPRPLVPVYDWKQQGKGWIIPASFVLPEVNFDPTTYAKVSSRKEGPFYFLNPFPKGGGIIRDLHVLPKSSEHRHHHLTRRAKFISIRLVIPKPPSFLDLQTILQRTRLYPDMLLEVPLHTKFLLILSILCSTHLGILKNDRKYRGMMEGVWIFWTQEKCDWHHLYIYTRAQVWYWWVSVINRFTSSTM